LPATIRRDITELDRLGQLKKIRNGAERFLSSSPAAAPGLKGFYPKISDYGNFDENEAIARKAVELCREKDNIFIGEGHTTLLISEDYPHLVVLGGQNIKSQSMLVSPGKYARVQRQGGCTGGFREDRLYRRNFPFHSGRAGHRDNGPKSEPGHHGAAAKQERDGLPCVGVRWLA
jgi:hypothetical protein